MSAATEDPQRSPEAVMHDVAALIRSRARGATRGRWEIASEEVEERGKFRFEIGTPFTDYDSGESGHVLVAEVSGDCAGFIYPIHDARGDAVHIATFASPAVALAVADLLDNAADLYGASESRDLFAWEVAMAYLGGAT